MTATNKRARPSAAADLVGLKARLDEVYESFNAPESAADPVEIVRRFPDPADRDWKAAMRRRALSVRDARVDRVSRWGLTSE